MRAVISDWIWSYFYYIFVYSYISNRCNRMAATNEACIVLEMMHADPTWQPAGSVAGRQAGRSERPHKVAGSWPDSLHVARSCSSRAELCSSIRVHPAQED
jgi:hypothetical protein